MHPPRSRRAHLDPLVRRLRILSRHAQNGRHLPALRIQRHALRTEGNARRNQFAVKAKPGNGIAGGGHPARQFKQCGLIRDHDIDVARHRCIQRIQTAGIDLPGAAQAAGNFLDYPTGAPNEAAGVVAIDITGDDPRRRRAEPEHPFRQASPPATFGNGGCDQGRVIREIADACPETGPALINRRDGLHRPVSADLKHVVDLVDENRLDIQGPAKHPWFRPVLQICTAFSPGRAGIGAEKHIILKRLVINNQRKRQPEVFGSEPFDLHFGERRKSAGDKAIKADLRARPIIAQHTGELAAARQNIEPDFHVCGSGLHR